MIQGSDLRARVSFGVLQSADGEAGNFRKGPYEPEFTVWANVKPMNGGEEVMAGRLAGNRVVLITVRSSEQTRAVDTEMSCRDEGTGDCFNIVEVKDPDGKRQWIEVLARTGIAGGGIVGEQDIT